MATGHILLYILKNIIILVLKTKSVGDFFFLPFFNKYSNLTSVSKPVCSCLRNPFSLSCLIQFNPSTFYHTCLQLGSSLCGMEAIYGFRYLQDSFIKILNKCKLNLCTKREHPADHCSQSFDYLQRFSSGLGGLVSGHCP